VLLVLLAGGVQQNKEEKRQDQNLMKKVA